MEGHVFDRRFYMKIEFAAVMAADENIHILSLKSDEGETIRVGQEIPIELVDGTIETRRLMLRYLKNS